MEKKSASCIELWNSLSPVGVCTGKMAANKLKKKPMVVEATGEGA